MNLKINIKRPQISKEEIAANKNFGDVLKMYKANTKASVPFYKSTWFYPSLSAAAAVVIAILMYVEPAGKSDSLAFINPPLENVKITPSQYAVNAEAGATITYKTGSVIKIPAKAFVDKGGNPVYGKVDIKYRELNDPIDFFLSGIPMNYDTAGTRYTFESAGMIEIQASQQGKELELNPETELAIALASHESERSFNLYKLDTEKKQWVYQGKEEEAVKKEKLAVGPAHAGQTANSEPQTDIKSPQLAALDTKIENAEHEYKKSQSVVKHLESLKPFEPKEETKGHHRFALSVKNIKDFPELAIYKDVMFAAGAENKNFDEKAYNIDWDDAKLSRKGASYILTLRKDDVTPQVQEYIVHPVFEGEGYVEAQKIYEAKLDEYQQSVAERLATEGEKQQELAALTEVMKEVSSQQSAVTNKQNSEQAAASQQPVAITNPGNLTFHKFTVHSCGIWNLDNPTNLPSGSMVKAHFTNENGKELKFASDRIYLVEKGRNILFSFEGSALISYNPEKQNMIWGVTADNKIAIFSYDDFKAIGKQSGDYTFKMKVSDMDMADEARVEYYLNI